MFSTPQNQQNEHPELIYYYILYDTFHHKIYNNKVFSLVYFL